MDYSRILLKLSGEWLASKTTAAPIDYDIVQDLAIQIRTLVKQKCEVAIVIGGGNFWRGAPASQTGMPRSRADYIGMLATIMNALTLQSVLEAAGLKARTVSALPIDPRVAQPLVLEEITAALAQGEVVIIAGGTGRPYFTTDTAATLAAIEIGAAVLLLGKNNVAGIYSADPKLNPQARHYSQISYAQILAKDLKVMDATAVALARDNRLKLLVFDIGAPNAITNVLQGKGKFTKVTE